MHLGHGDLRSRQTAQEDVHAVPRLLRPSNTASSQAAVDFSIFRQDVFGSPFEVVTEAVRLFLNAASHKVLGRDAQPLSKSFEPLDRLIWEGPLLSLWQAERKWKRHKHGICILRPLKLNIASYTHRFFVQAVAHPSHYLHLSYRTARL